MTRIGWEISYSVSNKDNITNHLSYNSITRPISSTSSEPSDSESSRVTDSGTT